MSDVILSFHLIPDSVSRVTTLPGHSSLCGMPSNIVSPVSSDHETLYETHETLTLTRLTVLQGWGPIVSGQCCVSAHWLLAPQCVFCILYSVFPMSQCTLCHDKQCLCILCEILYTNPETIFGPSYFSKVFPTGDWNPLGVQRWSDPTQGWHSFSRAVDHQHLTSDWFWDRMVASDWSVVTPWEHLRCLAR